MAMDGRAWQSDGRPSPVGSEPACDQVLATGSYARMAELSLPPAAVPPATYTLPLIAAAGGSRWAGSRV